MTDTTALVPTQEEMETEPITEKLPTWSGKGRPPTAIAKQIREQKVAFYKKKKKNDTAIVTVKKFDMFMDEFIRNGGNATEAAWKVYNCKNRAIAASIGHQMVQKAKNEIGRVFLETEGAGYGDLLKIAIKKTIDSDKPDWWDRLMKIAGYEDFINKSPKGFAAGPTNIINVIGQTQKDIASEYIEGEYVEDEDGNQEN